MIPLPLSPTLQQAIVAQAREWVGTRFKHQGRCKRTGTHPGGVDCLGLIAGVAGELSLRGCDGSLLHRHDAPVYSKMPDGAVLEARLDALLLRVPMASMQPGDIGLFALDGNPQHLAIFGDYSNGYAEFPPSLREGGGGRAYTGPHPNPPPQGEGIATCLHQNPYAMIHAYAPARKVVEHRLDAQWHNRLQGVFRVPG